MGNRNPAPFQGIGGSIQPWGGHFIPLDEAKAFDRARQVAGDVVAVVPAVMVGSGTNPPAIQLLPGLEPVAEAMAKNVILDDLDHPLLGPGHESGGSLPFPIGNQYR